MEKKFCRAEANTNIHHVAGNDLLKPEEGRFSEYRRRWYEWPARAFAGPFPLFIDIEATSACNLKCSFCATTYRGRAIRHGFVSSAVVKRVIDEGRDNGLYGVKFNIRGEPLLHPEIHEFVRYAKKAGLVDVYFNTNAMLLTENIAQSLIDAGLDRISISFEGTTKEAYERYRIGSRYESVLRHIEGIATLKRRLGVTHPKVRIQTVAVPEVKAALKEYRSFWSERADEVCILDYKEMKEKRAGVKFDWACPQIWQRMAVWWDGTILPCNHDDDGLMALGNVKDVAMEDAWRCKKIDGIRDMHKKGMAHKVPACDGCYLRDSEILKLKAKG